MKANLVRIYNETVEPKIQELLKEVKIRLKTIHDYRPDLKPDERTEPQKQQFKDAVTYLSENFPNKTQISTFLNIHMPKGDRGTPLFNEKQEYLGYYDVYKGIKKEDPTYVYSELQGGYRNLKTRKVKRKSKKKSSSRNKRSHSKGKKNNSKKKRKITKKK